MKTISCFISDLRLIRATVYVVIYRMLAHAIELLTAGSDRAEILLHEERYDLGGTSMAELHRLVYAQVLSSHMLTWQVSANKPNMIIC